MSITELVTMVALVYSVTKKSHVTDGAVYLGKIRPEHRLPRQ